MDAAAARSNRVDVHHHDLTTGKQCGKNVPCRRVRRRVTELRSDHRAIAHVVIHICREKLVAAAARVLGLYDLHQLVVRAVTGLGTAQVRLCPARYCNPGILGVVVGWIVDHDRRLAGEAGQGVEYGRR